MTSSPQRLGVAMIGHAFMGAVHSQAWRTAPRVADLPLRPVMKVLCGRDGDRARVAAQRLGWEDAESDWRAVIAREDIDVIDICTPGDSHAQIAIAALEAGKHVLCEKPLANTVAQAEEMTAAARAASSRGVRSMLGFTYRRVPALALARQLIADGRLGVLRQARAQYLQDWLAEDQAPHSWRLERDRAGSGALGDIGAHLIDLAQHLTGESVHEVVARLETFVDQRPLPTGSGTAPVTVDDTAVWVAIMGEQVLATFEATRMATGRKNAIRIEINGSLGSLSFDFEELNVLHFMETADGPNAGFRRILVTEADHPYLSSWWPPGHLLGYEHAFSHQVIDLVGDIAAGRDPIPSFADGLQVQRVIGAVLDSAASKSWESVA